MTTALTPALIAIFKAQSAGWQDELEAVWPHLGEDDKDFIETLVLG